MEAIQILLVEDNEGDIFLTKEALEEAKMITELNVVKDGKEAIDFVTLQGKYSNVPKPDLILLDVNLPKKNGHEVLQYLKADKNLKHIPVIMLTTSSFQKDINLAYDSYVNCYITKPIEAKDFVQVVTTIENFWMYLVKLPAK